MCVSLYKTVSEDIRYRVKLITLQLKRQQRGSCTGSTASGWEKSFPTSFLSLPPQLSESRSDCVPGRRSPALLSGCRGSVASPWQPPPVDIPAAPAGRARLRWTAWSAHSPCSRTATDTKTQKPLLSHSTGTFYLLTEYTFTDALINQFIFHVHTPLLAFWAKTMLLMKLINCWFSHIGRVTLTMDTSAPVEF